ncbi:hypothetical protein CKO51_11200 [Rhodopirellula sp. SM50]|nr:hypothetical protein CKO51_11200 [Rhodopirellula sp. SM50]
MTDDKPPSRRSVFPAAFCEQSEGPEQSPTLANPCPIHCNCSFADPGSDAVLTASANVDCQLLTFLSPAIAHPRRPPALVRGGEIAPIQPTQNSHV